MKQFLEILLVVAAGWSFPSFSAVTDEDVSDRIGREQAEKSSDYVALQALQEEQERVEAQLEEKMERWMYLSELAEQLGV